LIGAGAGEVLVPPGAVVGAHCLGDGAGDVARVEPEPAGDAQDLVADLLSGHGGD